MAFVNSFLSLMSLKELFSLSVICSNSEGLEFGNNEYPKTLAPHNFKI